MASPEPASLPAGLDAALEAFRHHIEAERGLSRHTVRAYLGDVAALLEHAASAGVTGPADLGIGTLRAWLADQHGRGQSRATLARRAAAARAFTAFARARGLMPSDPATFQHLMQAMASRYAGKVKAYEMWNEEKLARETGQGNNG